MAIDEDVLEALYSQDGITCFKVENKSSSGKLIGKVFTIEFNSSEKLKKFIDGAKISYSRDGYTGDYFAYTSHQEVLAKIELTMNGNQLFAMGDLRNNRLETSQVIRYLSALGIELFNEDKGLLIENFKPDRSNSEVIGVKILKTKQEQKKEEIELEEIHHHGNQYILTVKNADRAGGHVVIECQNQAERDELASTILKKTKKNMPTDAKTTTNLLNSSGLGIDVEGTDEVRRSIYIQRANYPRGPKADSDNLRNTPEINNAITTFNTHLSGKEQFKGGSGQWQVPARLSKVTPPKGPFFLGAAAGASAGVFIVQQVGLFGLIAGAGLFGSVVVAKVMALAAVLAVIALPAVVVGVAAYVAYGLFSKYSSCKKKVNTEAPEESNGCSLFSSSTPSTSSP